MALLVGALMVDRSWAYSSPFCLVGIALFLKGVNKLLDNM